MKNLFMILILLGLFLTGQGQQFSISGFSKDFDTEEHNPEVRFFTDYFHTSDSYKSIIKSINSTESKFLFAFTPEKNYGYVRIKANNIPRTLYSNVLLIKSGDSVKVCRDSNRKLYFTGKGASLLNYQIWLGKQLASEYKKYYGSDIGLQYQKEFVNKILNLVEDSLTVHRGEWGDSLYNVMKHASISAVKRNYVGSITPFRGAEVDSSYNQKIKIELKHLLNQQQSFIKDSAPYILDNFFYTDYLFTLIERYLYSITNSKTPTFELYYKEIEKFEGTTRDRLMVYTMLSKSSLEGTYDRYEQIMKNMTDTASKEKLLKISALLPGAPLQDFVFQDRNGKIIKLSDFKGKVLIIKTWYYGCIGCAGVSKMLEPVIEHYKSNSKVVFLSINADKKKETFEKGIESSLYGNEGSSRFVYTNGLGFAHPMFLYYNFYSAPNMLIVGKDSNIITSNPPRRTDNKIVQEWITLIDSALKKQ